MSIRPKHEIPRWGASGVCGSRVSLPLPAKGAVCCAATVWLLALIAILLVAGFASAEESPQPRCKSYDVNRRPFFGDTHVHTTYSQDASTQDTRVTPRDAYRFARGAEMGIQPYDENGKALRTVRLERPLDFAVVTDHAEQIGEVHICKTPGLPGHDSWVCRIYRRFPRASFYLMNAKYSLIGTRWAFCGDDAVHCLQSASLIWGDTQAAAEEANDTSDECDFTAFIGYEWTASPGGAHLHRNVIFRNSVVPELPVSSMETGPDAVKLWQGLDRDCRDARPGCEAITIPHNSNISEGAAFSSADVEEGTLTEEDGPLRRRYDRLVEIMQHKGNSECALMPGVRDELCAFEEVTIGTRLPLTSVPKARAVNYVRDALKRGLALQKEGGLNPFKYGIIASTDTHLGAAGLTDERGHPGHGGAGLPARDAVPPGLADNLEFNPGGLAVLWAEENTRESLFAAMKRREAYGTSGTRPVVRFFGGWDYPADLCTSPNGIERAYSGGVPMGGDLAAPPSSVTAPVFLVSALRDPHHSAGDIERLQIVKGWLDENGERRERVFDVTEKLGDKVGVDLSTCERRGQGHSRLCVQWRDPDFDRSSHAFYYARVLETPSCRWSQWICAEHKVDCRDEASVAEELRGCCAAEHRRVIQERAWTSPIWYTP